jgi:RND superfamily putative drug exporter
VLTLTLIGGLGALVVLAFVFGSLLALAPLLVAAVSILATFLVVVVLTTFTQVNVIVEYLVALIGLGVAIDYSLLLVTRWREERAHGHSGDQAVHRAMASAGRAVVLSGSTVAVGLLSMVVLPVPFLRSVGYAGMLIPLLSALVTLSLLPVILAGAGRRLDWPRWRLRKEAASSRAWTAWARGVVRARWAAVLLAVALLAVLGGFAPSLRIGTTRADALADSGPAHEGLRMLRSVGVPAGVLTPIEVLVPRGTDPGALAARLARLPGVWTAAAPDGPAWRRDGTALISVQPAPEPSSQAGARVVDQVRTLTRHQAGGVQVGGPATEDLDFSRAVYGRFPLMLAVIAAITFVLLTRAFRSPLLAAKAIAVDLLSIGAVFGAMVLVWQDGRGSQAIAGIPATGAMDTFIPLMVFAFLFGLSMDYEVFLLTRMREAYDRTGSTTDAVVQGVGRTGRLVTSAALILFLAFASLAGAPQTEIKVFATALGAGILLDATVVRSLLVPALVAMLGRWNWWLPAWAARPLRVHPSSTAPQAARR